MKTIVVYYSRTGNTRKIAEEVSNTLGCDIEELIDTQDRSGPLGYMRSALNAVRKNLAVLKNIQHDPSAYDLVIIGTPVWNMKLSTPARTYVIQNIAKFNNVALLCTATGPSFDSCLKDLKNLGISPIGTLGLRDKEVKAASYHSKMDEFIKEIQQ